MSDSATQNDIYTLHRIRTFSRMVCEAVEERMYGMDAVIKMVLIALYSKGHVLFEGNPGLGKTALVKTISAVLGLDFGRIQFTPDLMPQDIVGTKVPDPEETERVNLILGVGPIFTTLLLADEINRATPKTQSALLEAMAERQVTISGITRKISPAQYVNTALVAEDHRNSQQRDWPFMVLATQNPIDHEGTFELPEAQSDRFMFKLLMPAPSHTALGQIMVKQAGESARNEIGGRKVADLRNADDDDIKSIFKGSSVSAWQWEKVDSHGALYDILRDIKPTPSLEELVKNLMLATNDPETALRSNTGDPADSKNDKIIKTLNKESKQRLYDFLVDESGDSVLRYGLGPRAAIALMLAAKAWTMLFDTEVDNPETKANTLAFAHVAIPVLRHRLKLRYGWYEHERFKVIKEKPESTRVDHFIHQLCERCLPQGLPHPDTDNKLIPLAEYQVDKAAFSDTLEGYAKRQVY